LPTGSSIDDTQVYDDVIRHIFNLYISAMFYKGNCYGSHRGSGDNPIVNIDVCL